MGVLEFNVWLDTVFLMLWIFVILFLIFHFILFITTGRFRKAFIEGKWPEHDSRPPATPKWLHGFHMVGIIILAITGMLIRFPQGNRIIVRDIHYFWMVVVIITLVWRVLYAFFSKTNADWREFTIGGKDIRTIGGVLKYYGYMSNEKPHVAKYNVLQKFSYLLFLVLMIVQAFSGLALLTQTIPLINASPRDLLIGWWLGALAGSTDLAGWGARMLHYIVNWVFIIMMTVHFYLAFSVDIPCALDFFGIKEMEVHPDAHGHGHGEALPAPEVAPGPEPAM
jgi:Ni/Fe-hydrogenase 1 B-type cytochrome subunit